MIVKKKTGPKRPGTPPKKPPAEKAGGTSRKGRGPTKRYEPPVPLSGHSIDEMIVAMFYHLLPARSPQHLPLSESMAQSIKAFLYQVRDGPLPATTKRDPSDEHKALVARELMIAFRMPKREAVRAAYFDEIEAAALVDDPSSTIEACTRRFERHVVAIAEREGRQHAASPPPSAVMFREDDIFSAAIAAATRTEAGRAALAKEFRQQKG